MWMLIAKVVIYGSIIVAASMLAEKLPRIGALILTLPMVSILTMIVAWQRLHDIDKQATFAMETLILVPLGLPFFVPLAFANKWGLGFWTAFLLGIALAAVTIGMWFWLGPKNA